MNASRRQETRVWPEIASAEDMEYTDSWSVHLMTLDADGRKRQDYIKRGQQEQT